MKADESAQSRISHPNVIVVYQVGTFDDQVFMARDLVEGSSMTAWIHERHRRVAEVLDVFMNSRSRSVSAPHSRSSRSPIWSQPPCPRRKPAAFRPTGRSQRLRRPQEVAFAGPP